MSDKPRRWTFDHPDGGRKDVDGVEWFACDPYPTWYRWKGDELITTEYTVQPRWPNEV